MIRSHLVDFLNRHKSVQGIFAGIIFTLFSLYIICFTLDLYNLVFSAVMNYELVKTDNNLKVLDDFELSNTTLKVGDNEYKNVNIVFYGVSPSKNIAYFNEKENTLVQRLPKNYGLTFLIVSKGVLVYCMLLISNLFLVYFRHINISLDILNSKLARASLCAFFIIYTLVFICALILLS